MKDQVAREQLSLRGAGAVTSATSAMGTDRAGGSEDAGYRSFFTLSSPLEAMTVLVPRPANDRCSLVTRFLPNPWLGLGPLEFITQSLPQSQEMGLLLSPDKDRETQRGEVNSQRSHSQERAVGNQVGEER